MLHRAISPRVEQIMSSNRIISFKVMLVGTDFDDMWVVDMLASGIRVCGRLPPTGISRRCESKEETLSVSLLLGYRGDAKAEKKRCL